MKKGGAPPFHQPVAVLQMAFFWIKNKRHIVRAERIRKVFVSFTRWFPHTESTESTRSGAAEAQLYQMKLSDLKHSSLVYLDQMAQPAADPKNQGKIIEGGVNVFGTVTVCGERREKLPDGRSSNTHFSHFCASCCRLSSRPSCGLRRPEAPRSTCTLSTCRR